MAVDINEYNISSTRTPRRVDRLDPAAEAEAGAAAAVGVDAVVQATARGAARGP